MFDTLTESPDFTLTEDQAAIRDLARDFAETELKPHRNEWDESQEFPMDAFKKMGALGFLGTLVSTELGGAGLGAQENSIIIEEIARVDPAVALSVAAHNGLCSAHINKFASDEIRAKYMPPLARGEILGAWGLTEPSAGSDAGGTRTVAVRDGDHYILNGAKNFITHGTVGDTTVIMAVTEPGKGARGISAFVLDKSMPGFYASKKENKLGMRCSDTSSLVMDNVRVPARNRIGAEGEGFVQALQILDGGRISIAALALGTAQGAFEAAIAYAQTREQFGKPIAAQQAIQFKLAQMGMKLEAARALTYKAAWLRDAGQPFGKAASMAKLFASEAAVNLSEEAIQIHGGYGYIKEYPVEKFWRDSKLLTIGEGTSEVQRMVIARKVIEENAQN
ncbi:MAG: acyl-CoA dehydrogenase family protein [Bacteroidota bacterium]|nr:acyl-CoA dehydrogenase family protein [Bacteroidota bacterium]MDP4232129.1 acyl-CoA dehydrogenase family protein [Bacteroidota bacterium]MDP4241163.1 acyl-CoA dehydrogenase family protein [Bacteroidota bacterium]MDP4286555.1 acyl-CoA dehydrogenase family protein [Bacteroidota bacterium]